MGHCLLSQAIMSWYTKLHPSTIAILCIIITGIIIIAIQYFCKLSLGTSICFTEPLSYNFRNTVCNWVHKYWLQAEPLAKYFTCFSFHGSKWLNPALCHSIVIETVRSWYSFNCIRVYGLGIKIRWLETYGYIKYGQSCYWNATP